MNLPPPTSRRRPAPSSSVEPLEARIAPATFDLTPFNGQGPFTLEVDPNDSHIHIITGAAGEIFDQGLGPGDDLFVTGGGPADTFIIASSAAGNLNFTGTLSVIVPGPINVSGPAGTGVDLALTSTGAGINFATTLALGASDAHFTAARNLAFAPGSTLSTDSGDIVLLANQGAGQNGTFTGITLNAATITTTGAGTIQLTGTGGNASNDNNGISLLPGAVISSTSSLLTAGTISLTGKAGPGITNNRGVVLSGNGTTFITSTNGDISITGLGSPGSSGTNNVGVQVLNGAEISSNGTGANAAAITINGTGGAGVDFNHGVFVDGSGQDPLITSVDGAISITGTALATANGQGSRGISIEQGAQIVATGGVVNTPTITLQGTGGGGSDNRQGVFINQTGSLVSAAEGFVMITGTGGAGGAGNANNGVRVAASATVSAQGSNGVIIAGIEGAGTNSAGISLTGGVITATGPAGVELSANNLNIDAIASVNGGPGGTLLHPRSGAIPIDLGGADVPGTVLGISDAEINRITGGAVTIGNNLSGAISVSAPITSAVGLSLRSPASVSGLPSITVSGGHSLVINGASGIDLSGAIIAAATNLTAGPTADVTLVNPANDFGAVVAAGNNIMLRDDTGFDLAGATVGTLLTVESAGTITQSGPIAGTGGLSKLGNGILILSAANTYAGTTTINAGTVQLGDARALGSTLGATIITNGAALDLNGQAVVAEPISSVVGSGVGGTGAITNGKPVAASFAGAITNDGASIGGGGEITLSGSVLGNTLTKVGANTLTLSGSTDNSNLVLDVQAGTVNLGKSSGQNVRAVAGIADIAVNATVRLTGTGTDQILGAAAGAFGLVNISGGTLDLNNHDESIGRLTGTGTVTNTNTDATTLTVGEAGATATFAGSIQGHLTLAKIGSGVLILTGAPTYLDGTSVIAGTLQFDIFGSALNGAIDLSSSDGVGALVFNLPVPAISLSPLVTLSGSPVIRIPAGKEVTLTNVISGPGSLIKEGDGTLILANELNSFGPGLVQISAGILQVATDGALGDLANDVEINDATFAATSGFVSARNFLNGTGGIATVDAQVPDLTLINKAIMPANLTPTNPANLAFAIVYADTTPVPENKIVVGNTSVTLAGGGTLTIHKSSPTTIDTIELTGSTSATKLIINAVDPNVVTTVLRIVIDNPAPGNDPADIASIGSITLGKNVRLGHGVRDSVPDLYVEGKVGKLQLYDLNSYTIIRLGDGLLYDVAADKKTPDTYNNLPSVTVHEVLGPGVLFDLTPSDLVDGSNVPIGGGGLGKVVVDTWGFPGFVRTTQSMKSFKLNNGDCFVVFDIDKYHVGTVTTANVGSMTIPNGSWGSSGSEIEGEIGSFSADAFLAGATLTAGGMGKFTLDAGAFAGLLTLTDPDSAGIPTFTVATDFSGVVVSESSLRKIKVKGDFTGELQATFIGSITAYAFLGTDTPGEYNQIIATDGSLGTLTTTAGVVKNFAIVTDQAFKGFNIKLGKLANDTVGIDNVRIQALSIGNISVNLAAAKSAAGIDLIGIRNSEFITTGTGTTKTDLGGIGNITVTLAGTTGGSSAIGIQDSTFDALVTTNEFGMNDASTVNALGKIAVKISGQDGVSLGLDGAAFYGNSIGATAIGVTPGKGGGATATAIDGAGFTATGAVGALAISGSATSAMVTALNVSAGTTVGAVTVKSAVAANGSLKDSAILAGQALDVSSGTAPELLARLAQATLGAVNVTGSILDTMLVAGGSIGAVTAGGSMNDSLVLAGARFGGDFVIDGDETYQRVAGIAFITVKGAFARTSIVAGVNPGDFVFGNGDDAIAAAVALVDKTSSIGLVSIGAGGSTAPGTPIYQYAIQAAALKGLKLGAAPALAIPSPLVLDSEVLIRVLV